ncbi:alpha/beta hydrolase [Streptomonospora halophila]|uniref:Alpha/beta hydrolase n=1 Tax=Streptomonospora halophila TaxID=427369 RepID=A0ABP9GHS6_9ACTN
MNTPQGIYRSEAGARAVRDHYRGLLERWSVPNTHVRVPTREGETFAVACGPETAPPVVLLHGSGTNTAMWMGDAAVWAEHFRVYAVDVIGEPGFSAPSRPPLGSAAYAGWLDEVLDGLGVARAAVVGASLGGWLALDYATRRPERVTRLALLCPGGIGRQKSGWMLKALLLRPFGRWGQRRTLEAVAGLRGAGTREFLDSMALTFAHFRPRMERLPAFSDDALRGLPMPVLAVVGAHDAMLDSHETARRLRRCVPHATVHVLRDAAHSIVGQASTVHHFLRGPSGT